MTSVTGLLFCAISLSCPGAVGASDAAMKGPPVRSPQPLPQEDATSSAEIAFLRAIELYQKWLSPIGGVDRCGFIPSCSAYGCLAIKEQGPLIGLLMTADRLTRCHIWKKPGADYRLLNGRLYDPPSQNLLCEP